MDRKYGQSCVQIGRIPAEEQDEEGQDRARAGRGRSLLKQGDSRWEAEVGPLVIQGCGRGCPVGEGPLSRRVGGSEPYLGGLCGSGGSDEWNSKSHIN